MTEKRFKHSKFIQEDNQLIYYGIEDTITHHVYNVVGEGIYDVSEKELINLLNNFADENKKLKKENHRLISVTALKIAEYQRKTLDLIDEYIDIAQKYRTPIKDVPLGEDIGYWNGIYLYMKELKKELSEYKHLKKTP